uniref:Uncharacterized protein n=1 Tax=Myoviridae sp. ct8ME27 TaxID=2826622 RepID=A0A8S5N878_9CAUD|nr:MAG TPA: hypothetical protein [Myoviridae sp. ct8ME27]
MEVEEVSFFQYSKLIEAVIGSVVVPAEVSFNHPRGVNVVVEPSVGMSPVKKVSPLQTVLPLESLIYEYSMGTYPRISISFDV